MLLGADFYEDGRPSDGMPGIGIGRDVVLNRTIIDKNARIGDGARLVNERNVEHADGDGWCIRGGIVVVPKGGVIPPGPSCSWSLVVGGWSLVWCSRSSSTIVSRSLGEGRWPWVTANHQPPTTNH